MTVDNLITFLKTRTELTNTVLSTNMFKTGQVPQNQAFPFMILGKSGDEPARDHGSHSGIDILSIQFDILTRDDNQAETISAALRGLDGYRGAIDGVRSEASFIDLPVDNTDEPFDGETFAPCRYTMIGRFFHRATVTTWT